MKKIILFIILFFNNLYGMDIFSSENDDESSSSSSQSSTLTQNPPKFWRIKDKNNPSLNYAATETSIQMVLVILNSIKKENSKVISKLYINSLAPNTEKITQTYAASCLTQKNSNKLMILIKKDGSIKTEWIRHLILHSVLLDITEKILTFEELLDKQAIVPVNEEDKVNFWKIGDHTFATETIKYVIKELETIYSADYSLIVKLKKACDQNIDKLSDDCIEILIKNRFVRVDGTLNLWAKIISSIVLYKHSTYGIQLRSFQYLIKNAIIIPNQIGPNANYNIDEFNSDIISSEVILKLKEGEPDEQEKLNISANYILPNTDIMQDTEKTSTNKTQINCNNCN